LRCRGGAVTQSDGRGIDAGQNEISLRGKWVLKYTFSGVAGGDRRKEKE